MGVSNIKLKSFVLNKYLNPRFPLLSRYPADSAVDMVKFLFVEIKERG